MTEIGVVTTERREGRINTYLRCPGNERSSDRRLYEIEDPPPSKVLSSKEYNEEDRNFELLKKRIGNPI